MTMIREDGAPVRWVAVADDAMSRRVKQMMRQVQEPGSDDASRREREKRILLLVSAGEPLSPSYVSRTVFIRHAFFRDMRVGWQDE